jgi:hypothetical protein
MTFPQDCPLASGQASSTRRGLAKLLLSVGLVDPHRSHCFQLNSSWSSTRIGSPLLAESARPCATCYRWSKVRSIHVPNIREPKGRGVGRRRAPPRATSELGDVQLSSLRSVSDSRSALAATARNPKSLSRACAAGPCGEEERLRGDDEEGGAALLKETTKWTQVVQHLEFTRSGRESTEVNVRRRFRPCATCGR